MGNGGTLTKVLAVLGVAFAWLPLLAGILAALAGVGDQPFTALWYVTAAVGPAAFLGGLLLLWASFRSRTRLALVSWSCGAAVVLWAAAAGVSLLTGLASGRVQEGGWQSALVVVLYVGFALATVAMGVAGIVLLRDLGASRAEPAPPTSENAPT